MKYLRLIGKMVLVLAFTLGLLIATADDAEVASLDPARPATLWPLVASRLHAVRVFVRDFRARDLLDAATAGFRERIHHESPPPSPRP